MLNLMGAGRLCSLGRILANLTFCVLLTLFQGLTSATCLEATSQALMRKNSFLASKYSVNTHDHKGNICIFLPKRVLSPIENSAFWVK